MRDNTAIFLGIRLSRVWGGSGGRRQALPQQHGFEASFGSGPKRAYAPSALPFCKQPKILPWFFGSIGNPVP